jgi:SAM-dependent methyltransferase
MKDHYKTIPGWFNCPDLYHEMVTKATQKATFVEIGCWKGKSSSFMAEQIMNSKKDIQFYCIDTWKGTLTEDGHQNDPDVVNNRLFEVFNHNLSPFTGYYNPIRSTSVEAANQFEDNSLDAVYIDGEHLYDYIRSDVQAWKDKIKDGGILCGHDYDHNHSLSIDKILREFGLVNKFTVYPDTSWSVVINRP